MGVNINRGTGSLNRSAPTEDAVICMMITGVATSALGLSVPKQIFSANELAALGITLNNNPLAFNEINDYYAIMGDGAEFNFMLINDTTSLSDMCNPTMNIASKLLDFANGRACVFMISRKAATGYTATISNGLDVDVWNAVTKLGLLQNKYATANIPFVGVLPALGFTLTALSTIPDRSTQSNDTVALNAYCKNSDGLPSMGLLAAWIAKHQVHQNVGRVDSGKASDTAYLPDSSAWSAFKDAVVALNNKGLLFPMKRGARSGYYYYDDPTVTSVSSDYSSISWNRVMNKVQRITNDVLLNKLNDDVDVDPTTGKVEGSLTADWESEVETQIKALMMKATGTTKQEISGVKCSIDPNSDILNDEIDAAVNVVRKGQAKTINVTIKYTQTV